MSRVTQPQTHIKRLVRRYPLLRQQMKSIGMGYPELAQGINRARIYVARCMTGKYSYTIAECYKIRMLTGLAGHPIEEVFPDAD